VDFDLSEEQIMLKRSVRDFLEKEIAPIAGERDRQGLFTKEELAGYIKKLIPFGYYIERVPEEYGGANLDYVTIAILYEELARVWGSLADAVSSAAGHPSTIAHATEELRQRFLPALIEADLIACGAITEPNVGSNTAGIETTAVLDGDEYIINGSKTWINNALIADLVSVFCVTDKSQEKHGISRIMVERKKSPYTTREIPKIGFHAAPIGEMSFADCRVPRENLIRDAISAYGTTMTGLGWSRVIMAAIAVGISQAAIDASIQYALERKQFGRPIGSFQLVQELIADMINDTEASRLLTYQAAYVVGKGARAHLECSRAKAFATEAAVKTTSKAMEIHGAMGFSEEYPLERYFRDAKMTTIPDGTIEIQKLIIGREAIGIKAFV